MSENDQDTAVNTTQDTADNANAAGDDNIKKITNPLTVIGVFASLAEVGGTVVTALVPSLQSIYIWFVIGFPTLLLILFFLTLNFNHIKLYAPGDYGSDKTFLISNKLYKKATDNYKRRINELEKEFDELIKLINEKTAAGISVNVNKRRKSAEGVSGETAKLKLVDTSKSFDSKIADISNKLNETKIAASMYSDIAESMEKHRRNPDKLLSALVDRSFDI